MDCGLVTLGGTEACGKPLREAAEHATGADADLVLLSAFTRREYEHDLEVLDRIATSERNFPGEDEGAEFARVAGEQLARELLSEFDVEYRVAGAVVDGRLGRRSVSEAEDRGCDHVFVTSKRRSRIGGALGETARTVLRRYDGVTSIARERNPDRRLARLRGRSASTVELDWV